MKLFRTVIAALLLLCSTVATAHDFTVGGIYYNILSSTDQTVEVTYGGNSYVSAKSYSGSVTIPSSVTYDGTTYTVTAVGEYTFYNCEISSVTLPWSVATIGNYAFWFSKIEEISITNGVRTIESNAFYACTNLRTVVLPQSLTTIGSEAFLDCTALTSITIPSGVLTIGEGAFRDCSSLTSATISSSVKTIGKSAFSGCALTSIEIPNSVTTIDESAFSKCKALTAITIPDNVTTLGASAFANCTGLTSATIGNGVKSIARNLFNQCSNLTSVAMSNSVEKIEYGAFLSCSALTEITIPSSVASIEQEAFSGCTSLASVTSYISGSKLFTPGKNAFYSVPKGCTLYIPKGSKEQYAATSVWKSFSNIVELDGGEFDLVVSAAKYATLFLDFDAIIPQGVEVYTASTVDGNRLMMEMVTDILPANTGVIVRAKQGTYSFYQSYDLPQTIEGNLFRGSVEDVYITPAKEAKYYVLSMKDGVVGMYEDALSGGTFKNNANNAYLVLGEKNLGIYDEEVDTEDPGMQLSNSYYFDFGGTTAIDPIVTECEENVYYDLSGRRVENPTQGIYIVNGKKVLVK